MSGLKRHLHALTIANSEYAITPDEVDRYEIFSISAPGINTAWWASAGTAGTAASVACVLISEIADWPMNVRFALAGSAAGMAGSLDIVGVDQFGGSVSETITFTAADNGGTGVGTKVFAAINSGTLRYGTAVGNGTPAIGFVTGTDCLFGLPLKIGGTTDVVLLSQANGTGAVSYGGGTVAAFVNTAYHAIRPAATVTGTTTINVWVNPTYKSDNTIPRMAKLAQQT